MRHLSCCSCISDILVVGLDHQGHDDLEIIVIDGGSPVWAISKHRALFLNKRGSLPLPTKLLKRALK